ncbi:MAG TPA: hypothetical protein VGK73_13345 [Polyangiaceae bacterium]
MPAPRRRLLPLCLLPLACGVAQAQVVAPPAPPPKALRPILPARDAPEPEPPRAKLPPPPAPPPGPLAELADPVPVTLESAGRGGRWIVACTARADTDGNGRIEVKVGAGGALGGDALRGELIVGGRAVEAIDDLLASDPTGRYVVVRQGKSVSVVDVTREERLDLGALGFDDRDDTLAHRQHRALAFDPRGEILAYVRATPQRELVLRTLESGAERVVAALPGDVWRFSWDGTGAQLVVSSVDLDTTENGRLDWPARVAKRPRLRCQGPVPRFAVSVENGDRPSTFIVPRDAARAAPAPEFAASFGSAWISRAADGALYLQRSKGRRLFSGADCGARILHSDPERDVLLVACTGGKNPQKAAVELLSPTSRLELGVFIQPAFFDRSPEAPLRLFPLYPGSEALLVDLERRLALPLTPGDRVIATSGARALVRRADKLFFFDGHSGRESALPGNIERLANVVTDGPRVAVGSRIFDLAEPRELGSVTGRPLALATNGEALVAEGGGASADRLARGPLRWQTPNQAP